MKKIHLFIYILTIIKKKLKENIGNKMIIYLKIKIIIDHNLKTFAQLFKQCDCIKSIYFKKFYRTNITDMNEMFYECSTLKKNLFF